MPRPVWRLPRPVAEHHRAVTSFVHHRARLTDYGQRAAWDRWWPVRGHDVADLVNGALDYDLAAWFGRAAPLILEIGSGMGESTAALAAAEPDVDHLAVEVFEPGIAALLMRATELTNLVVLRGDAVALLSEKVPEASLAGIRVFFPDPWPKRRHHKRRLVQPAFAALAVTRLGPAAPCTWPPTGPTTPSRCARSPTPSRGWWAARCRGHRGGPSPSSRPVPGPKAATSTISFTAGHLAITKGSRVRRSAPLTDDGGPAR